jgi:template-activating factor I
VYPRKLGEVEDGLPADPGSFFNFFEHSSDPMEVSLLSSPAPLVTDVGKQQVGLVIANEVFPESIEYFLGNVENDVSDSEDEEDDDDEAEEIDLEKPRAKKARR